MKGLYIFVAATVLAAASNVFAFTPAVDTVYADSVYQNVSLGMSSTANAFGKPDRQYAKMAGGVQFDVVFYRHNGKTVTKTLLPIKPRSTLIIWGKKDPAVDTSAGAVSFCWYDNFDYLQQSQQFILNKDSTVIQVPDTQFVYLEFTLPGDPFGVSAQSYYIDAIALVEDTAQPSGAVLPAADAQPFGLVANYPNPFAGRTNVNFILPQSGTVEIAAVDAVGIVKRRFSLGYQESGSHIAPIDLGEKGLYFLRLIVDGIPVGNPIKVISE